MRNVERFEKWNIGSPIFMFNQSAKQERLKSVSTSKAELFGRKFQIEYFLKVNLFLVDIQMITLFILPFC